MPNCPYDNMGVFTLCMLGNISHSTIAALPPDCLSSHRSASEAVHFTQSPLARSRHSCSVLISDMILTNAMHPVQSSAIHGVLRAHSLNMSDFTHKSFVDVVGGINWPHAAVHDQDRAISRLSRPSRGLFAPRGLLETFSGSHHPSTNI